MNRTESAAMHRTCVAYRVMLTSETERQIKTAFDTLDSNRDGLLTREDWTQLELGPNLNRQMLCLSRRWVIPHVAVDHVSWRATDQFRTGACGNLRRTFCAGASFACVSLCAPVCMHPCTDGGRFPRIGQSHRVARGLRR